MEIKEAVDCLLETARREFEEPQGDPSHYRFSLTDKNLEIMHAARRPLDWRVIPLNCGKADEKADAE